MVRWGLMGLLILAIIGHWYWIKNNEVVRKNGQRVKLTFTLRQQPQIKYGQEYLNFQNIEILVPETQEINYGDYIQVIGTIKSQVTVTGTNKISLQIESFEVVPGRTTLAKGINTLRLFMISEIKHYLPPEEAGLAAGMLFGGTQDMTQAQILAYRRAGLSHVVAASGYNVTLVAGWAVWLITKILSRKLSIPVVIIIIILYSVMAGGTASVVRAAVMGIIAALGLILGRETDIKWVLLLSVFLMLAIKPDYLTDIGFELSVAATAGLVFFNPKSVWWTTIAAQVATMPIILHYFGNLSLVAPLSNILILWTVPLIMQITAVAVVTGGALSYLAWPLLKWCNLSTTYLASFRFSSLTVSPMNWFWVTAYYLVLVIIYKLKFEAKS